MSRDVAAVLDAAADRIGTIGWVQSANPGPNGELCAVRSIVNVLTDWSTLGPVMLAFENEIETCPARWNDAPGRTKAEVVAALRAAAAAERGDG